MSTKAVLLVIMKQGDSAVTDVLPRIVTTIQSNTGIISAILAFAMNSGLFGALADRSTGMNADLTSYVLYDFSIRGQNKLVPKPKRMPVILVRGRNSHPLVYHGL